MELQILLAGVEFGPYSEDKARQLLDEGFLSATDPAKRLDETDWLPLSDLLGSSPAAPVEEMTAPATPEVPHFRALAASLAEEPTEEFHAPIPAGSEVADVSLDEMPAESEEPAAEAAGSPAIPEVEAEPAPEPAPPANLKPDLTVSRPTTPAFRATIPIPPRPATGSLPPPRLTTESKTATQSLRKSRRAAGNRHRTGLTQARDGGTQVLIRRRARQDTLCLFRRYRSPSRSDAPVIHAPPATGGGEARHQIFLSKAGRRKGSRGKSNRT